MTTDDLDGSREKEDLCAVDARPRPSLEITLEKGPKLPTTVIKTLKRSISKRTLERAEVQSGASNQKEKDGWYWSLSVRTPLTPVTPVGAFPRTTPRKRRRAWRPWSDTRILCQPVVWSDIARRR